MFTQLHHFHRALFILLFASNPMILWDMLGQTGNIITSLVRVRVQLGFVMTQCQSTSEKKGGLSIHV